MAFRPAFTIHEREVISRELAKPDTSCRYIGSLLGRSFSAVAREIKRNGGRCAYRAVAAQQRCDEQRSRPKPRKLENYARLHDEVCEGLKQKWSPQQISKRLKKDFSDDKNMRVSHETIYECLYLQARGQLRTDLKLSLRTGRTRRVDRSRAAQTAATVGKIKDMVNISERPVEANDRAIPGFWEGDLILGKGNKSQTATLVERTTRFVILVKIPYDRRTERVVSLLASKMEALPQIMKNSITYDQGKELAQHKEFTVRTGMPVYFCDPHSPWQRGSNENTNGLLRQYFPKGTDLSGYSQAELDAVAAELNNRPRETLDWEKPAEAYEKLLTTAGVDMNP